jgi:hypothetical protein
MTQKTYSRLSLSVCSQPWKCWDRHGRVQTREYIHESPTELVALNIESYRTWKTYILGGSLEVQVFVTFQFAKKLGRYDDDFSPICVGPVRLIFVQSSAFSEDILAVANELADNTIGRKLEGFLWVQERVLSITVEERISYNEDSE